MTQSSAAIKLEPQIDSPIQPNLNWGPNSPTRHRISAYGFVPGSSSYAFTTDSDGYRWFNSGSDVRVWYAPLTLPAGASIIYVGAEVIDSMPGAGYEISLAITTCPDYSGCVHTWVASSTGSSGHQYIGAYLASPIPVDNFYNTYYLDIWQQYAYDGSLKFRSVQVDYMLQVSPAPAYATFYDVPTSHIFFQYIEALVASGITTGCATNYYCPDNYVTRGQMATFLSRALGLHYPY